MLGKAVSSVSVGETVHETDRSLDARLVQMASLVCDETEQSQSPQGETVQLALWIVSGPGCGDQGSSVWSAAFAVLAPGFLADVVAE